SLDHRPLATSESEAAFAADLDEEMRDLRALSEDERDLEDHAFGRRAELVRPVRLAVDVEDVVGEEAPPERRLTDVVVRAVDARELIRRLGVEDGPDRGDRLVRDAEGVRGDAGFDVDAASVRSAAEATVEHD